MSTLENLIKSNPRIGALVEHMIQSESSSEVDTTEYLNKFEVVKDILDGLNIKHGELKHSDYEKLCPVLMNALLVLSSKLERVTVDEWDNNVVYIDLTTNDPEESRKIDACFERYDHLKNLDPVELKTRFMYRSSFSDLNRLDRLVLAKTLVDCAIDKHFDPLLMWVKYLDSNGLKG